MAVDQDNVSKILSVLSHSLRREILTILSEKGECSFTDLMNALNVDTGKLSFHIRSLSAFLEQTSTGKYKLSNVGENAIRLIKDVEAWAAVAEVARKNTVFPIASFKKRAIAFLIDVAVAGGFFLGLPSVFSLFGANVTAQVPIILILFLFLLWVYLTLLEGFAGQTLGKRVMGLKVVRTDGKRLFYDHAAVRSFGKVFLMPIDLVVGYRLKDKRFIRYFDKFSGTTVVDLRA
jgi:uncharacterized RDD family membrane protein YckC/DNA-binding transcriptional ArsR family regulator